MTLFLLIISAIINIFFIWYIIKLLKQLIFVSENIETMIDVAKEFSTHLKSLHEMQTFYGDETLQSLIKHSEYTIDEIEKFEYVFSPITKEEEEIDEEEKEED
tara:strand:- start:248 stop:556 length:309 start_codon:yes stop_codon:yes gene_type:complete